MGKKIKTNLGKYNDIEFISANEEIAIYRVAIPSKNMSIQERHKILKDVRNTTVHFFNIDDINNLNVIQAKLHEEAKLHEDGKVDKSKKSLFNIVYEFLEI